MNNRTHLGDLAAQACRRWPEASDKSLGRYLSMRHPTMFESEEKGRSEIRYYRGHMGSDHRKNVTDPYPRVAMPKSLAREKVDWVFPEGKWLLWGDLHVPYHDTGAITRTIADAKANGITGMMFAGDLQDCEGVGSFFDPTIRRDFIREVETMIDFLDFIRGKFKKIPIIWMPGNHEERLETYYARNAPVLADLPTADMSTLLSLESRGITVLDRRQGVIARAEHEAGNLYGYHGHTILRGMAVTVSPARTVILKTKANAFVFHVHRNSYQPETACSGREYATWSVGCQCNLSPDYNRDANNWRHGHAFLEVQGTEWEFTLRRHLRDGRIMGGI